MKDCRQLLVTAEEHLEIILMLDRHAQNAQLGDTVQKLLCLLVDACLEQLAFDIGVQRAKILERGFDKEGAAGVGNAEAQGADNTAHNAFNLAFGQVLEGAHVFCLLVKHASCLRKQYLPAAAGGDDELGAKIVFQGTQLLAQRRLGDVHVIGRTGKAAGLNDGQKISVIV